MLTRRHLVFPICPSVRVNKNIPLARMWPRITVVVGYIDNIVDSQCQETHEALAIASRFATLTSFVPLFSNLYTFN